MAGLVLEGGSFRCIFTAGILDALLDNEVEFEYVIGVSAGITNGLSYISKQKGRNPRVLYKYRNDKRYFSKRNLFRYKSLFGLDFVFDELPNKLDAFDWETYLSFKGKVRIGVTNALTGECEYLDGKNMSKTCDYLKATCAIPLFFPVAKIDNNLYYDGGLSDSIPIKKSILDGNEKNLIIMTRPKGYMKKESKKTKFIVELLFKNKYPGLIKSLNNRHIMYNETINYINEISSNNDKKTIVLYPPLNIKSFESNVNKLEEVYKIGYELGINNLESIKELCK